MKGNLLLVKNHIGKSAVMALSLLTLLAEVIATKNETFMDRWGMEHVAKGSKGGLESVNRARLRPH